MSHPKPSVAKLIEAGRIREALPPEARCQIVEPHPPHIQEVTWQDYIGSYRCDGERRCPDDGFCHHACGAGPCFRVQACSPLSRTFPGDQWPDEILTANGVALPEVKAFDSYPTNGHLIAAAARMGFLQRNWWTLDPTYGEGVFWSVWRPDRLIASDLHPDKSPIGHVVDFTALPWQDRHFDAVVLDPPYKLNGTPDEAVDERYGVHVPTRWQDRMELCRAGIVEAARVSNRMLLVKCQDQVCSGKVRWQTREFADLAEAQGFRLVTQMHRQGGRSQPTDKPCKVCADVEGVRESCENCGRTGRTPITKQHPAQNYSTLLVLKRTGR